MKTVRFALLMGWIVGALGCGTDRFPRSQEGDVFAGTLPFTKVDTAPETSNALGVQSLVFVDPLGPLREPFLLDRGDGWWLYYGADDGTLRLTRKARDSTRWSTPETVLEPRQEWEGAGVTAPTLLEGEGGRVVLWYAARDGAGIGRAESLDGRRFARDPAVPVLEAELPWEGAGVHSPAVALDVRGLPWMAYAGEGGIGLARSEDGVRWDRVDGDPGRSGSDPILTPGDPDRWDGLAVRAPFLAVERSVLGREVFRLWYEGEGRLEALLGTPLDSSIGEAASFGPAAWVRFEGNPVLAELPPLGLGRGVDEREPALVGTRGARCMVFATGAGATATRGAGLAGEGAACSAGSGIPQGN